MWILIVTIVVVSVSGVAVNSSSTEFASRRSCERAAAAVLSSPNLSGPITGTQALCTEK